MSVNAVTAAGRRAAEARMTSRCRILRKTGRSAQNEQTGEQSPEWLAIHADLPVRLDEPRNREVDVDGVTYQEATGLAHLPATTVDLQDGDYLDVLSGEWAGFVCSIVEAVRADQKTARRVPIREESRPEEWGF